MKTLPQPPLSTKIQSATQATRQIAPLAFSKLPSCANTAHTGSVIHTAKSSNSPKAPESKQSRGDENRSVRLNLRNERGPILARRDNGIYQSRRPPVYLPESIPERGACLLQAPRAKGKFVRDYRRLAMAARKARPRSFVRYSDVYNSQPAELCRGSCCCCLLACLQGIPAHELADRPERFAGEGFIERKGHEFGGLMYWVFECIVCLNLFA